MEDLRVGFVGAGQMARALARGFVQAGLISGEQILVSDSSLGAVNEFLAYNAGAKGFGDNHQLVKSADIVFLAVKPQSIDAALEEIGDAAAGKLLVSIVAGVPLARLAAGLPERTRLIRVMPNTPCLVGHSASGYALHESATDEDARQVGQLLDAVGRAFRLEERLLDAVTGLSGSGPAYVCLVIEAMSDGGVKMGLPREVATALATETLLGTAKMLLQSDDHPAQLKDRVASPGGTTIAGLAALEAAGVRGAFIAAVEEATLRATELGMK